MNIKVQSANLLTSELKESLEKKLTEIFDSPLNIDYHQDPNVIGGLRITTPSKVLDLSLAAKLNGLRESLVNSN